MACNDFVVGTIAVGNSPLGIQIISGGTKVYVSNLSDNSISIIDAATSGTTTLNLPGQPRQIAWNGTNKALIPLVNISQVVTVNTDTATTGTTITVGGNPFGVVYDSVHDYFYVGNGGAGAGNTISVISGASDTVIATITGGTSPYGMAWDSTNDRVYVANENGPTVSVIDTNTNTITQTISGFTRPYGVAFNTNNDKIYVTEVTGGTFDTYVRVIDTSTNTITGTILLGEQGGYELGFDAVHNRIYVANSQSNTVSIIDCNTDTLCNTLSVSNGPFDTVYNPTDNYTYVTNSNSGQVTLIEIVPDPTPTPTNTLTSTPTPTPTLTETLPIDTPTPTPTNTVTSTPTSTPTVTPTTSVTSTPSNTPTLTVTATEVEDSFTLSACCDGTVYTVVNVQGTLTVGNTYIISGITGLDVSCYTVTSDTVGPLPYYDGSSAMYMEQIDCNDVDCPTCPTPTPTISQTSTPTPTPTPTLTSTPTSTPTQTLTASPQVTFTPTPTTSVTSSPTPTPTATDFCAPKTLTISVFDTTPTPSPTPTNTPTPSGTNAINILSSCYWVINNAGFLCNDVKRIQDCITGNFYYTTEPLIFGMDLITSGTTFAGEVNGLYRCLTYVDDADGSATDTISNISAIYTGGCSTCITTPTPTPSNTATVTPTPSVTPTLTPTTTSSGELFFVYSSCTISNTMIVQTIQAPGITEGQVLQYSGFCWTYVGNFVDYIPPAGFVVYNYTGNYLSGASGPFTSCAECILPTPTPTLTARAWNVTWAWSTSCFPCELTDGGISTTLYTVPSVSTLTDGVYVYTDAALTIPFSSGRYFRSGNLIFKTLTGGEINQHCVFGGSC